MVKTNRLFFFRIFAALAVFALLFSGCGRLDNLDADDFDFFDNDDDRSGAELRRYSDPAESSSPLVEYIFDNANPTSTSYEKHIRKICDYTKLPYRSTNLKEWSDSPEISSTTRVISILETKKLSQKAIERLIKFVAEGGTLFLPFASEDHRMAFLIGFKPDAEYATDIKSKGFFFKAPLLPNMKGKTTGDENVHYGFAKDNFTKDIRVLATAVNNSEYPLVIENLIGKGRVVLYNTSGSMEKVDRGLLFSGILKGIEGIPYPIANTSTIFLDDFPSPLYDVKSEPIASEMNLSISDYVKKVWWPDMVALAEKHNMSYSAMIAFDYKNKVLPPYIFDQWDAVKIKSGRRTESMSDWLVRDVARKGHELAFHGYNHVSLVKELWPNPEHIGPALKAVQKKWEVNNFGPMPVTYVPPSNIIDKYGVNELKKGMPSLKYMCSLYLGEIGDGGGREFDFDPYNKDFFDYPRISSGFYLNDKKKYTHESMFLFTGIWTHFVHPDDVYQIDNPFNISKGDYELRNGRNLGWHKTKGKDYGLLSEFTDYIDQMTTAFPQMRFLNAGDGGAIVNDWRASRFRHMGEDGNYIVEEINSKDSFTNKQYWFLYGSHENSLKIENQLKNESAIFSKTPYMDGYLYMVYTSKPKLRLKDLQYKNKLQPELLTKISRKVENDYRRFQGNVQRYLSGGDIKVVDEEKLFQQELVSLRKKMLTDSKIDTLTWNKYARYMSWDDRGNEVWKMLEEHCVKHPHKENIMYSKILAQIVDYPNELSREKWMSAQMLVTPNDKDLLNSYVASFYTPENQEKIRRALVNLLKVDTSFNTYLQYLQHLLMYDPPSVLKELEGKKPTAEFAPVATDVAWLYANEGQYEKAFEWSQFSDEIDFASKMNWLIEMRAYKILDQEYKKHIAANPDDYRVKAAMVNVYMDTGRFRDAWILANSLPEIPEKDELRDLLNKDVLYVESDLQQELLADHSELFLPEVREMLEKTYRKERADFVSFDSQAESNKNDPQSWRNILSYNHYDKNLNLHSFSGTYSTMYKVNLPVKDLDNVTHAIGGIQYQFTSKKTDEKLEYWSKARIEYSDYQKFYYQFGAGAFLSKKRSFQSAQFRLYPAETGPAHSKRIYRMQLNLYQDYYFMKYLNASVSLEGNFYTKSKETTNVRIDQSYEGSFTGRLAMDKPEEKKMKFIPFVEGTLTQASVGRSIISPNLGYPYWMIDKRLFGGGGLEWKYGLSEDNLIARVEAAYFFDDYTDQFQRYAGEISYQLFDYTAVSASFEIYAQSKFYSNAVQLGVKYNLKPRKKNRNRE